MLAAIVGWIGGLIVGMGSAIASAIAAIWAGLSAVWGAIAALSTEVYKLFAELGQRIWDFARTLWDDVLSPLFDTLTEWWNRFIGFLRDVIEPILDRLRWLGDLIDRIYKRIITPILEWVERARLILAGLGLLGVGWAKSLSQILQQVEGQVNNAFLQVEQYIYEITNVINDVLSPFGYIKRKVFLSSVYRWNQGIVVILTALGIDPNLEARRRARRERVEIPTLPMVTDRWTRLVLHDHPAVQSAVQAFKEGKFRSGEYRRGTY